LLHRDAQPFSSLHAARAPVASYVCRGVAAPATTDLNLAREPAVPFSFIDSVLSHPVITEEEVERIREELHKDGHLNLADVKLVVELYCGATKFPPSFRDLLFATLEEVLLADGGIEPTEQFYLLKMICGLKFDDEARQFVRRLRGKLSGCTAELDATLAGFI
jgi:hypothetical protein